MFFPFFRSVFLPGLLLFCFLFMPVSAVSAADVLSPDRRMVERETEPLVIKGQDGTVHAFQVELADTPQKRSYGLMNRMEMPEDAGMLFVFPVEQELGFWMRNTYIPLDMIFIGEGGVIEKIHEKAVPLDETPIRSGVPVIAVLEINGGVASKRGITPGDIIHHPFFGNKLAE